MVLSGREKATIFLSIVGAEAAARVLRYLPEELADIIAAGVNHLPSPSPEALTEVLEEFQGYMALPGERTAHRLEAPEYQPKPQAPRKAYSALLYERPQMAAFILSLMSAEERSEAFLSLPKERALLEDLMKTMKKNVLTPKIEPKIRELFSGKIF